MRAWVTTRERLARGQSMAWWLLDDLTWVVCVVGRGLMHEPADANLLKNLLADSDWEEVRFSPTLR